MRWALNQITLHGRSRHAPADLQQDLAAVRAGGWRAVELWLPHWDPFIERHGLAAARTLLDQSGLRAAGGCGLDGSGSLFFSEGTELSIAHDVLRRRLEQCAALGADHLVIAPGFELPQTPVVGDLDRAVESLRHAGQAAARHGVRLGIEFLAGARLVKTLPAAWWIVEQVAHPMLGLVVDTYHLYAGLSKTEDLALIARDTSKLFFVHVSDVAAKKPRDLWTVPDRTLPCAPRAGGVPNAALLDRVRELGYDAYVSLELFSAEFEQRWMTDSVRAARDAYDRCTTLMPDAAD